MITRARERIDRERESEREEGGTESRETEREGKRGEGEAATRAIRVVSNFLIFHHCRLCVIEATSQTRVASGSSTTGPGIQVALA